MTQDEAGYTAAPAPNLSCHMCQNFQVADNTCTIVDGRIDSGGFCNFWTRISLDQFVANVNTLNNININKLT